MSLSVMHVIGNVARGGAEQHLLELVRALKAQQIAVEVVCPRSGPLTEGLRAEAVLVHEIEMVRPWSHDEYLFNRDAYSALATLFKQRQPALVHSHLYPAHLHASLAAQQSDIPAIVQTAHTLIVRSGESLLSALVPVHTIAVSRTVAELLKRGGVPEERIEVIYNGIGPEHLELPDQELLARLHQQLDIQQGFVVGTVARLSPEKGLDVLLHAVSYLHQELAALQVLIIGDGPERPALEQLTAELGLEKTICFLGARADISLLNHLFDLFVLPSREEACPMALLEAMAASRAVVATAVGGTSEIIAHEHNGWLVPPDHPRLLAQAISTLLTQPAQRQALGSAARKTVETDFTRARMLQQTLALYQRLLPEMYARPSSYLV